MTTQSIASRIVEAHTGDFAALLEETCALSVAQDQDWDAETTVFQFVDGSKIRACSPFGVVEPVE